MIAVPEVALSIRQPFSELILRGEKTEEFRDWVLPARWAGAWLALHAPAKIGMAGYPEDRVQYGALGNPPRNAIVGVIRFGLGIRHGMTGTFVWPISAVVRLPEPIACKGALGFWRLPDDVREEIARQLAAMEQSEGRTA